MESSAAFLDACRPGPQSPARHFGAGRRPDGARWLPQGQQCRAENRPAARRVEVERTFTGRASGKDASRPKLDELLAFVRDGDTVMVHSMDRLARNLDDLRRLVRTLTGKGVRVEFVKESLVFTGEDSPMATLLLSVMGAFAEFERAPDPRTPARRHRRGQATRRLHRPQTRPHHREQARHLRERAAAGEQKPRAGQGVRDQPRTVFSYLRATSPAAAVTG
jgi:DNA invertase Pin-like site-specific DNA recombinase